jgi:recombination protein RecA
MLKIMTERSNIVSIWDKMNRLYGDDGMGRIGDVKSLTTGSKVLDEALGVWGNPRGRIIQYAGKESSGKTFMSLMAIREWQRLDPKNWAYFIDAEYSFDMEWASSLGVDTSEKRLRILRSNNGSEIFEKLCGVPSKEPGKPKAKPGLLDLVDECGGADASGLGIIVLDSIAAVAPPMELASRAGKNNMSLMARFMPPELRKLVPLLSCTDVIFIAINQVRTNPGQLFGDPESTPGGAAWKHHCSVMVHFTTQERKDSRIFNEFGDQIGHRVSARIDKNKVGQPRRRCEFDIEYLNGIINKNIEIATLGVKYGVVLRPSLVKYTYDRDGEELKWRGKDNFYNALLDGNLSEEVFNKVVIAKEKGGMLVGMQEIEGD